MAFQIQIRTNLSSPANLASIRQQIQSGLSNINANVNLNITGATQQGISALSSSLRDLNVVLSEIAANSVTAATAINRIATTVGPLTAAVNKATTALTGQKGVLVDIAVQSERGSLLISKFGEQAGLAARRFIAFSLAAGTIFSVVSGIRQGVGAALEFERQLVRLEQVAGGNRRELRAVAEEISRVATAYGVSSRELAQTAVTLRQAGFTATQTAAALETLAQSALSPNFGSLEETTEGLIAIMQQFNLTITQASTGLNAINAVAADFAVEAKDIVSAVIRAGGAFATIGGDLNEFLAIFTAVRATTRESADAIATGLRTIFGRLQRSETIDALRELRINLRTTAAEAAALGNLNLTDQFVGPYEAIKRIAEGLRQIQSTDPRYSAIVEQIGGFRQISRVLPLIQEEETRERALASARGGSISLIASADTAQKSLLQTTVRLGEAFAETFRHLTNNPGFQAATRALLTLGEALNTVLRATEPLLPLLITLGTVKFLNFATPFAGGFLKQLVAPVSRLSSSVTGLATGGPVRPGGGPIGPTDTIPAMLTPGEYVFSAPAVARIGAGNLERLHQTARGYNNGGFIQYSGNLNPFQANAITDYSGTYSSNINKFLRGQFKDEISPGDLQQIKDLTSGIALGRIAQQRRLFRNFGKSGANAISEQIGTDIFSKDAIGRTFTDPGFFSTSTSRRIATNFGKYSLVIQPKIGNQAIRLNDFGLTPREHEKEVLLQRGSRFLINNVDTNYIRRRGEKGPRLFVEQLEGFNNGGLVSGRALSVPPYLSFDINALQGVGGNDLDKYIRLTRLAYRGIENQTRRLSPGIDLMSTFSSIQPGFFGSRPSLTQGVSGFLGDFNPVNRMIRLNLSTIKGPLELQNTLAHEIGHGIDFTLGESFRQQAVKNFGAHNFTFASEVKNNPLNLLSESYRRAGLPITSYFNTQIESAAELFRESLSPTRHPHVPNYDAYRLRTLRHLTPTFVSNVLNQIPRRYSQGGLVGFNHGGLVGSEFPGWSNIPGGSDADDPRFRLTRQEVNRAVATISRRLGVDVSPAFRNINIKDVRALNAATKEVITPLGTFNRRTGDISLSPSRITSRQTLLNTLSHEIGHAIARRLGDINVEKGGSLRNIAGRFLAAGGNIGAITPASSAYGEAAAQVASLAVNRNLRLGVQDSGIRRDIIQDYRDQVVRQFAATTGQLQQPSPYPILSSTPSISGPTSIPPPNFGVITGVSPQPPGIIQARQVYDPVGRIIVPQSPQLIVPQQQQARRLILPQTQTRTAGSVVSPTPAFLPPPENTFNPYTASVIRGSIATGLPLNVVAGAQSNRNASIRNLTAFPQPPLTYSGSIGAPPGPPLPPAPPIGGGPPGPNNPFRPNIGAFQAVQQQDSAVRFQRFLAGALGLQLLSSYGFGSARPQVTSESGIGYQAFAGAQGALGGAAIGGLVGAQLNTFAQGTSLAGIANSLPVIGLVIGGLSGLASAITEAAREIRQAQLDKEASKFKSSLEQLNVQLSQNGTINTSDFASVRSSFSSQLNLVNDEARARARLPYTFGLLPGTQNQFEAARRTTLAQTFQGSAGEIFGFLARSAQQTGRRNAGLSISGLENAFAGGNEGVNRQFISLIAQLQNRSLDAVIRSFRQDLIRGQSQELRSQAAGDESRLFVAFGTLASSVENAANQLSRFDTVLSGITGLVTGNISARVPTGLANNLGGSIGTPFFGGVVTGSTSFIQGQPGGVQLRDTLLAVNRVAEVLPNILATVLSEGQNTTSGVGTSVRRSLLSNFGFTEDNIPEQFRTVFNTVATKISDLDFDDFRRQSQDTQSLSRNLLQTYNPLIEVVQRLTSSQEQQVSSLIGGLEQYNRILLTVIDTQTRSDNLRLGALRTQAQITAEAAGRPSETLRFLGNPGEAFFNARQSRLLTGTGVADQFNPAAIGSALQQTQTELTDAQTRLAQLGPRASEEGQRLARTISELTGRATRLQAALQNLTDVASRTAIQQERLRELDTERANRQGFLSRFITGGPESRFQYERAFGLIGGALNNPRGLQGFGQDEASTIIRTLEELRGISLPFAGGRRGEDVLQTILQRTDPRLFGGINNERESIQQQILSAQRDAAEALNQSAQAQQSASRTFLDRLEALQRQFIQDLERSLLQAQAAQVRSQVNRITSQRAGLDALRPQEQFLSNLAGPGLDRSRLFEVLRAPSVQNAITSITQGLERSSVLTRIPEANFTDAATQLQRANLRFLPQDSLRPDSFAMGSRAAIIDQLRLLGITDTNLQSSVLDRFASLTGRTPAESRLTNDSILSNLREAISQVREDEVRRFADSDEGLRARRTLTSSNLNVPEFFRLGRQGSLSDINAALEAFRAQGIQNFDQLNARLNAANTELEGFRANLATINQQIFRISPQQQQNVATVTGIIGSGGGLAGLANLARPIYQEEGGPIFAPRGTDTVPAMLTPGEFVVNRASAQANRYLLEIINNARGRILGTDKPPQRYSPNAQLLNQQFDQALREGRVQRGYSEGGVVYLQHGGGLPQGIPGSFFDATLPRIPPDSRTYPGLVELARRDPRGVGLAQQRAIFLARRMLGISNAGLTGAQIGEMYDNYRNTLPARANLLEAFGASLTSPGGASGLLTGSGLSGRYRNTLLSQLGAQTDLGGDLGSQQQFAARSLESLIIRNILSFQQLGVSGGRGYNNVSGFFSTSRRPRRFFNSGGFVDGVDSVPAMLTPGEFVLNRQTVSQLGVNNLNRANYFQNGGVVTSATTTTSGDASIQTVTEAISSLSGRLEPLVTAFNTFERSAQLLSDALTRFPTTLTIEGRQTVEVIINGAQVLSQLQPEIQQMVVSQTREALQRFVSRNFPDLNSNEAS